MRTSCLTILSTIGLLLCAGTLLAGADVRGKVIGSDGTPLMNVSVQVLGSKLGAVSGADGSFLIKGVQAGKQTLSFNHAAYEVKQAEVEVSDNATAEVSLKFDREKVYSLGGVTITALRDYESPEKVPQTVSHITSEEIENNAGFNPGELLDFVPGVRIITSGSTLGGDQGVSIRSLNGGPASNKSLVLLDGRPVNGAWDGGMDWNSIPLELVDRIEVVKGPASALYGSQASAGVINILTRGVQSGFHGSVSLGRVTDGAKDITDKSADGYGRAEVGGTNFRFNTSYGGASSSHLLTLGVRRSDQQFVSTAKDKWDNFDLNYKLDHRFSDALRSSLHFGFHDDTWENRTSTTPNEVNSRDVSFDFMLKHVGRVGVFSSRTYLNAVKYEDKSLQNSSFSGNDAKRFGLSADYTVPFTQIQGTLVFGAEGVFDFADVDYTKAVMQMNYLGVSTVGVKNTQTGAITQRSVDFFEGAYGSTSQDYNLHDIALFAQYSQELGDRVNMVVGARLDNQSEFGTVFNPKAGATWRMFEFGPEGKLATSLKLNYGEGFRSPPMVDLYSKSLGGYGDNSLKPEKTQSFDIGLFQRFGDIGVLELTWFRMKVDDLLINDKAGSTGYGYYVAVPNSSGGIDTLSFNQRKNLGDYTPQGLELSFKVRPHKQITFSGAYSYLDPQNFTFQTSKRRFNFGVSAWQKIGNFRLEGEVKNRYTGDGFFFDYRSRPFESFSITDIRLALDLMNNYKISFYGNNLADTKYRLWHNAWMPGRSYTFQIETRF